MAKLTEEQKVQILEAADQLDDLIYKVDEVAEVAHKKISDVTLKIQDQLGDLQNWLYEKVEEGDTGYVKEEAPKSKSTFGESKPKTAEELIREFVNRGKDDIWSKLSGL